MKKMLYPILFVAGALQGGAVLAEAPPASPLIGSWAVDVARLATPPAERPKSVTITYSDAGSGNLGAKVEVVTPDGSEHHATSTYTLDGKAVRVEGNLEADTVAAKMPAPDVMVTALARGGVPASMRTYTVSTDGRTMTETVVFFSPEGSPVMRTNYFNRVR